MCVVDQAIEAVRESQVAFCKFLSANDTGETGAHQAGFYLPNKVAVKFSNQIDLNLPENQKDTEINIRWPDGVVTQGILTYYGKSKKESRITNFADTVDYFKDSRYTGALIIIAKIQEHDFRGFVLETDEELEAFFDAFGISVTETNKEINIVSYTDREKELIDAFIQQNGNTFPSTKEMAKAAQEIHNSLFGSSTVRTNPDKKILEWTKEEYSLFRILEEAMYGENIERGFLDIDSFLELAKSILNRRKSRAGKSLEHHLESIFDGNGLTYTAQGVTEGKKKPDFMFPSIEAYKDPNFPVDELVLLAAKTTCKDRWRQVVTEADRLVNKDKFLITLQQGISKPQMDEMQANKIILVVPKDYKKYYPEDYRDRIWTISEFIQHVKSLQEERG